MADRVTIICDGAPAAIGPYVQGVKLGEWMFLSGQIPLDAKSMTLLEGDIAEQTHLVLKNITAILESCGTSLGSVVKTTCFLDDMNDFAEFNKVYAEYFNYNPPARSTVEVAKLPMGAKVEIECIVHLNVKQDMGAASGSLL